MRKRRGIDRVRWGLGRRSLLTCRYLTSGGIKTVGFLCSRDEPGGCPPTGQVVSGMEDAWEKVKAKKGAPGTDGVAPAEFGKDLKGNLYKIWNRMSSGSYFPPPVKAVEIPKPHGSGTRILGVPTVADRIAQTVVAARLEKALERVFHPDSYGYRPGRSALDAVAACRKRCWKKDWLIDLDVEKFFDSVRWDLIVEAVEAP